jgi:hypothetical protein
MTDDGATLCVTGHPLQGHPFGATRELTVQAVLPAAPAAVTVNGKVATCQYDAATRRASVTFPDVPVIAGFTVAFERA